MRLLLLWSISLCKRLVLHSCKALHGDCSKRDPEQHLTGQNCQETHCGRVRNTCEDADTAEAHFLVWAVCSHSTQTSAGSTDEAVRIQQDALPALCPPLPQLLPWEAGWG